jgi:hypothetical protein
MMDLIKNLVGCLVAGVVIFGLAVFRDIEVENQSVGAAVTTGLIAGGGVAVILGVMVVVIHSRERRSRVESASDGDARCTHSG